MRSVVIGMCLATAVIKEGSALQSASTKAELPACNSARVERLPTTRCFLFTARSNSWSFALRLALTTSACARN
eukprot:3691400-Alexandrium_andersonii.AAC.1